jgi:hypothetical protein
MLQVLLRCVLRQAKKEASSDQQMSDRVSVQEDYVMTAVKQAYHKSYGL